MTSLGIDFEDAGVRAVCVNEDGTIRARAAQRADAGNLSGAVRSVIGAVCGDGKVGVLGVALPFMQDGLAPDLSAALTEIGAGPQTIATGHAVALAEAWCGAAQGAQNVVSFAIGDHVTAGIIIAGRPLSGANGHAGSVAFLALNPVEREDYRRHGGLEAEVAAAGIVRRLVWRIKSGDESHAADRVNGDLTRLTADDVFAAARDGDGVCESVVRDTAKYVGMAIANLVTVLDPDCVVLGGTLAASGDLMLEPIRAECAKRLRPMQSDNVRIVLGSLGDDAAALGAARVAMLHRR
jgi:predicted NBD/HSP70 family sugar kinase